MIDAAKIPPAAASANAPRRSLLWLGILFALAFPAVGTWLYFDVADDFSERTQKAVYSIFKIVQFAFPAVWAVLALREPLRTRRPTSSGVLMGLAFAALVVACGMVVFQLGLRNLPIFADAAVKIRDRIADFGVNSPAKFLVLAGFYCVLHSLLEEYYWRWFVFRQMRHVMPIWPAAVLSAIGFTLHHVFVLSGFFAGAPWLAALLTAAITVGGVFWAWLFNRSDSVFDVWPSHLLIDAGIFLGVGYQLVRPLFQTVS
jgi:membrane protease YdiL (CAAX protease family)